MEAILTFVRRLPLACTLIVCVCVCVCVCVVGVCVRARTYIYGAYLVRTIDYGEE